MEAICTQQDGEHESDNTTDNRKQGAMTGGNQAGDTLDILESMSLLFRIPAKKPAANITREVRRAFLAYLSMIAFHSFTER